MSARSVDLASGLWILRRKLCVDKDICYLTVKLDFVDHHIYLFEFVTTGVYMQAYSVDCRIVW